MGQAQRAGAQQPLTNLQPAGQRREQALCRESEAFGEFDTRGQFEAGGEALRKDEGELGVRQFAVGAQQVIDRAVADAAAQAGSRLRIEFAQAMQAEGIKPGNDLGWPPGHAARQGGERRLQFSYRFDTAGSADTGQPSGTKRRRCHCPVSAPALRPATVEYGVDNRRNAAEQPSATADFEQETGRWSKTDGRREAPGPTGEIGQRPDFARRIALVNAQAG